MTSRRDVADAVVEDVARNDAPAAIIPAAPRPLAPVAPLFGPGADINPAGLFKREGEDALTEALAALDLASLQSLISEHNLDPSGLAGGFDAAELVTHIVGQAKKRAERDDKMFDY